VSAVAEEITRVTPLGVRFADAATGATVTDGLRVVYRTPQAGTARAAFPTPGGAFAFADIPGLRESEYGTGDAAYWAAPPVTSTVTVEVNDRDGRFLPFSFTAPVPHRGLFGIDSMLSPPAASSHPPAGPPAMPLYSSPARALPAGLGVVRAELRDSGTGEPVPHAVLEVAVAGGGSGRGMADERGRVVALVPYPPPPDALTPGPRTLTGASWPLTVSVRFERGAVQAPHPDLPRALAQGFASVVALSPPLPPMLAFGRDTLLRSGGDTVLLITP
jgi:hypothetical protein